MDYNTLELIVEVFRRVLLFVIVCVIGLLFVSEVLVRVFHQIEFGWKLAVVVDFVLGHRVKVEFKSLQYDNQMVR